MHIFYHLLATWILNNMHIYLEVHYLLYVFINSLLLLINSLQTRVNMRKLYTIYIYFKWLVEKVI